MDTVVNFWGVLVAAIAAFVLGGFWFGPFFGKPWMRAVGITHEQMERMKEKGMSAMWRSYLAMFIGVLVMAYVLAHVLAVFSGSADAALGSLGVSGGLWMWIGFVAPVMLGPVLWEGRSWKYWFITAGYYLVSLILMGIIIVALG